MGWACHKSGIAVAHGWRLTGRCNMLRIAEHCAALRCG